MHNWEASRNTVPLTETLCFFSSRVVVTIRVSEEDKNVLWAWAFVERGFGNEYIPVGVKFVKLKPVGGFCRCPVDKSELCAHVDGVLYRASFKLSSSAAS